MTEDKLNFQWNDFEKNRKDSLKELREELLYVTEGVSDADNQKLTTQTIIETESAQSVFQTHESLPEAQIDISAQDPTNPSIQTYAFFEQLMAVPDQSNVLKSVVESTINDMMSLSGSNKAHHQHHNLQPNVKIEGLSPTHGLSQMSLSLLVQEDKLWKELLAAKSWRVES